MDIVINNAANALAQPIGQITPAAWAKSFAVNQQGPVFLVQSALPHLQRSEHAAVLNIVSAGAFIFSPTRRCTQRPRRRWCLSLVPWPPSSLPRASASTPWPQGLSTPTWCGVIHRSSRRRWPASAAQQDRHRRRNRRASFAFGFRRGEFYHRSDAPGRWRHGGAMRRDYQHPMSDY